MRSLLVLVALTLFTSTGFAQNCANGKCTLAPITSVGSSCANGSCVVAQPIRSVAPVRTVVTAQPVRKVFGAIFGRRCR